MVEAKRRRNETFDSLLRRFSKKIQQSGKLLQAKKVRYFTKPKSKNLKRVSTLHRLKIKEQKEYLRKVGKLPEETRDRRSRGGRF